MAELLTHEQAESQLLDGNIIIGNGAYAYVSDDEYSHFYYMAHGTYPGCLRGGAAPKFTDQHWLKNTWLRLSTIDVIIRNGWFQSNDGRHMADAVLNKDRLDGLPTPSFEDMVTYALDNKTPADLLKDPRTSGPYWKEYFVKKGLYPAEKQNA
jgi:hypothetical protein